MATIRKRVFFWLVTETDKSGERVTKKFKTKEALDKYKEANSDKKLTVKEGNAAFLVSYRDGQGARRFKQFPKQKLAQEWMTTALFEVQQGVHTPASATVTVAEAAERWLRQADLDGLERSTIAQYRQHTKHHINKFIGSVRLADLSVASVKDFRNKLIEEGRSAALVKKVISSLGTLLSEAQEDHLVSRNVVREFSGRRKSRRKNASQDRHKKRLEVGTNIPAPDEIRSIIAALTPDSSFRPMAITAIFTGLRSSELRGLPWSNLDFENNLVRVRQRADRYNAIGATKSKTSARDVPMTPMVKNTLLAWRECCPASALDLVFPTGAGRVASLANIWNRSLSPLLCGLGLTVETGRTDKDGQPILRGKYGMHGFRHFYASWLINRRRDGGLEMPAKVVQERLGHSSITITMDTYSHLFPVDDGFAEMADAEKTLLAAR